MDPVTDHNKNEKRKRKVGIETSIQETPVDHAIEKEMEPEVVQAETQPKKKKSKKNKEKQAEENSNSEDAVAAEGDGDQTASKATGSSSSSSNAVATTATTTTTSSSSAPSASSSAIFSDQLFAALPISQPTKDALQQLGFERMTLIQAKSIPECLSGSDLVGAAKTGSGKTLAFLIPIIELLHRVQFTRKQGTGAIVISPTRELSLQIYGILRDLMDYTHFPQTHGLIMGGANRRAEAEKLIKGVNILIATPGRLHDHLANTKGFLTSRLQILVIDEADRILEQGFEEDMHHIIGFLPKEQRQTILFSATQTRKVEDLARLSMRSATPIYTGVHDDSNVATVEGLLQGYVVCPAEQRFMLLYSFLKKNMNKKIMVFFSSCNSVKFHAELLNYIDIEVMDIHGKQKQQKRTTTFFTFCKQSTGILLCTDVAARGLDIPAVDWIIQYDPPDDPKEYIHRVGRTARGINSSGRALLFLLPEELIFLKYLKAAKVTLQEFEFPLKKIANIGSQMTMLIEKNYYLHQSAKDAYRSYLMAYASHAHKDIFNVHEIDLAGVARAFGFSVPPRVDVSFSARGDKQQESRKGSMKKKMIGGSGRDGSGSSSNKQHQMNLSSGHAFSAENPYGKRAANDKRQFVH